MDGSLAIERNRQALMRIIASLVALVGSAGGTSIVPRHLYLAILRLLRPAESAVRRLIIAAARGIVVVLPPSRKPRPAMRRGPRTFMPVGPRRRRGSVRRILSLPLLDPLKRPFRIYRSHVPAHAVPRISGFDFGMAFRPAPPPALPDAPVDAARLALRLEVLVSALDDLPGQAKRFARWKARAAEAAGGQTKPVGARYRRISPLRPGRPPGGRLSRYDPTATHGGNIREIDEILAHAHALAVYALETPDTS